MSWTHDIRWGPYYCWPDPLNSRGTVVTFNPLQQSRYQDDYAATDPVEQTTTTDPHSITDEA